ncbi:hypothetical protein Taro_029148 [Colocasia esculenta]|uniref:Rho-GAP domain-containing protein n=1 Tax=Colocasia esculenta TaxID=4460 RepID=A0A843VTZ1_COLES|nr:hypothetical protein [Colocasia esculenta]
MQCSYDPRGNSVPTILLLMQRRLYEQNGLQAEGIFRINAENSQEEQVRDQLNGGIVPAGIDVHCLAGLIKAWFRELPTAVLDSLTPEQVMQCQTEEECVQLVKLLPQTEAGLLDWAVNLMADVVQEELHNKMNARNVAMVFAPNMTQMADPLTALMYAVQVMNFLKTLILKTLKERQESILESASASPPEPSDENGHSIPSLREEAPEEEEREQVFLPEEPVFEDSCQLPDDSTVIDIVESLLSSQEKATAEQISYSTDEQPCELPMVTDSPTSNSETTSSGCNMADPVNSQMARKDKINHSTCNKGMNKGNVQSFVQASFPAEKLKEISLLGRINSRAERVEAWR